ncbi:MAG: hypothetical protein RIC52_00225 [Amphiplicatus sp.]
MAIQALGSWSEDFLKIFSLQGVLCTLACRSSGSSRARIALLHLRKQFGCKADAAAMIGADEPIQFYEVERLIGPQYPAQFGVSINYHSAFVNANRPQPEGDVVQRSAKLSIGAELHNVSKRRLGTLLNRSVSVRANDWSGLWRRPRVGRPRDGEPEQRSAGIIKFAQILLGKDRRKKAFVGVRYEKSCADKPI